jgi:N-alpha-acetyltransferase 10/11
MVCIRRGEIEDILAVQNCNIHCLPENYTFKYYMYHLLSWPGLLFVAEDEGKIVGYVLAKLDDDLESSNITISSKTGKPKIKGHITSISVLREYRKQGLAKKLMDRVHVEMKEMYECDLVSLHVRVGNRGAFKLYSELLNYEIIKTEVGYYADGEDAFDMVKKL